MKKVNLKVIADALDEVTEEWHQFYNKRTGEVVALPNDRWAFDDEEEYDRLVDEIDESDDYLMLPDQYEIHEYGIMSDFADKKDSAELRRALQMRHPYRKFKDEINDLGIDDEYYAFRENAYYDMAEEWCQTKGLSYVDPRKKVRKKNGKANKRLRILFIGNSHTYFNDMPNMVKRRAVEDGFDCEVTMIAHGGWYLSQHVEEPEVRYNILFGNYDYVVLQEYSHPFGPEEKYFEAVRKLNEWIREVGSVPVIYETWAKKDEQPVQERMNAAHQKITEEIGALLAPVGEYWWGYQESWPDLNVYYEDGAHASAAGSEFAAKYIWETIRMDRVRNSIRERNV